MVNTEIRLTIFFAAKDDKLYTVSKTRAGADCGSDHELLIAKFRLDLIDRVPAELWMKVHNIVQETGIKTISMKKKCTKAKWPPEEALQIAVKRREVKSKGEKQRYCYLNVEFQRIARRDKKAFLRDQCKEIVENNRMGKTRDLFKKIRDTKGTFHATMGSTKDRNCMD